LFPVGVTAQFHYQDASGDLYTTRPIHFRDDLMTADASADDKHDDERYEYDDDSRTDGDYDDDNRADDKQIDDDRAADGPADEDYHIDDGPDDPSEDDSDYSEDPDPGEDE